MSRIRGDGEKLSSVARSGGLRVGLLCAAMCFACQTSAQVQHGRGGASETVKRQREAPAQLSPAVHGQRERLAILTQEKNKLLRQRNQLEKVGDKILLARVEADLQSIGREIDRAVKEPIFEVKRAPEGAKSPSSVPSGSVIPSQPAVSEVATYEPWDLFKNFRK